MSTASKVLFKAKLTHTNPIKASITITVNIPYKIRNIVYNLSIQYNNFPPQS